jgi:leucyl aminopeptidase (aminopeptidase T)
MASDLDRAVDTVLGRCLAVRESEEVLVVADPGRERLGHAMLAAARDLGADGALIILSPDPRRGFEPPRAVAAAFSACDVFLAPCEPSLSHTVARKAASEKGIRGATLPGVTEEMLARLMSADFDAMARRSAAVAQLLTDADEAHLTCPLGTDFRMDLRGREGIPDDGDLTAPGSFGNLPCGEGFISPAGGEGTIIAQTEPLTGLQKEPLRIEVRDGALADATNATFLAALDAHAPEGRNLAELGIGTNDQATLTGNVLEDEKILGTAHVAFGASAGIGGTVTVPVHLDVVVTDASLTIGSTQVLDAGRYLLDGGAGGGHVAAAGGAPT